MAFSLKTNTSKVFLQSLKISNASPRVILLGKTILYFCPKNKNEGETDEFLWSSLF